MKRICFTIALVTGLVASSAGQGTTRATVEGVFGRSATVQGDIIKITFPRTDLKVSVGPVQIEAGLALTSWAAFKDMETKAMMMGDLVLLEAEVGPVMTKLMEGGIEITALHNHILGESPRLLYLHFAGQGEPEHLARSMWQALQVTGTPLSTPRTSQSQAAVDWTKVESILGRKGTHSGDLLAIGFPRSEKIFDKGMDIPPFMGMASAINMQMIEGKAASTGDFVLLADEVNPVVQTLIKNGIAVTAIHSHMLSETPRLFFLHFWGFDGPEVVARGLRAALDNTNSVR